MNANDKQISGTHYKQVAIQPWDYVAANNLGYFEGSAIKYITRWQNKGGIADLQKAIHFLEKLIELESPKSDGVAIFPSAPIKNQSTDNLERPYFINKESHPSGYTNDTPMDWISLKQALEQWYGGE